MVDLILTGGKVVTLDPESRIAEAVAVSDGKIRAVGRDDEIATLADANAQRIDLAGRTVIPGLVDGHAHMDREGLKRRLPSLIGARSIADVQRRIEGLARDAAPGEWIVTMPIGTPPEYRDAPDCLAEGRFPDRHELDEAAPDNPVYIRAIWGHWRNTLPLVSVANSRALELAGITRDTEPPVAGIEIEKDAAGEPTGRLIEEIYKPVVEHTLMAAAPGFDAQDRVAGLRRSMAIYNSYGTTSVFEGHGIAGEVVAAYRTLREAGPLPVRAHLVFSPSWKATDGEEIRRLLQSWGAWLAGRGLGDEYLRMGALYTESEYTPENLIRTRTAPYTSWAGFNYDACLPEEAMVEMMVEAARCDIRIASFTPNILDLYERVNEVVPIADKRWVIEHIGIYDADEIKRIRNLGLVLTAYTNRYIYWDGGLLATELGAENGGRIVPLRALREAGVPVSLATDNVPPTLFHSIWNVVARKPVGSAEVIGPEQCVDRETALRAATVAGAHLTFEEDVKGTIEPGKMADLALLSDDPLTCAEEALKDIVAEVTIVGGRVVYDRAQDGDPTGYESEAS